MFMAGTGSAAFPLKTKQVAVEVNNIKTELLCTQYQEQIFCIVTQYQKIGNLVSVKQDNIVDESGSTKPMYNTNVLMGKDEPLTHVIARNLIAGLIIHKPILLSIALKDSSPSTVKTLSKILSSLM